MLLARSMLGILALGAHMGVYLRASTKSGSFMEFAVGPEGFPEGRIRVVTRLRPGTKRNQLFRPCCNMNLTQGPVM